MTALSHDAGSRPRSLDLRFSSLLVAFCALGLPACDVDGIDGNGERTSELRETGAFNRVLSGADLFVQITQGDEPAVLVSIDSNLQEQVTTRVSDGALYIDVREELGEMVDGPHVYVTTPHLRAAKLAGSGRMFVGLEQPEEPFDLILSGSGDLSFVGTSSALGANLTGSGDVRLQGETGALELDLSGSGDIDAKRLGAATGDITLTGSGDVSASVADEVSVSVSGSGRIDLYGGATLSHYADSGSGDVVEHD